jgi:hypothetical protein
MEGSVIGLSYEDMWLENTELEIDSDGEMFVDGELPDPRPRPRVDMDLCGCTLTDDRIFRGGLEWVGGAGKGAVFITWGLNSGSWIMGCIGGWICG